MVSARALGQGRTLSIVIPSFNTGVLLKEAVQSILNQSDSNAYFLSEIIVVDDNSNDPVTQEVIAALPQLDKVRVIPNVRRKGPSGARNTGAFSAQGEWLAFLDSDDVLLPDSLEFRFQALAAFPDAQFISGDFQIWFPDEDRIEDNFFLTRERTSTYYRKAYDSGKPEKVVRDATGSLSTVLCHSCSVLVSKDLFSAVGGYEESLTYKEDQHLWFKLEQKADLVIIPRSVFLYRQHRTNMTNAIAPPFEYERRLLDLILSQNPNEKISAYIRQRYPVGIAENAIWHRSRREFLQAAQECLIALKAYPFEAAIWRQLFASILRVG